MEAANRYIGERTIMKLRENTCGVKPEKFTVDGFAERSVMRIIKMPVYENA